MEESVLIKASLILALVGIGILILISDKIEIKEYNINDITKGLLEKEIKVTGKISKISETQGLYLIDINDKERKLKVVVFKENKNLSLQKNQLIEVTGKVVLYKKELEIEAKKIKIL
jgi:aspartyl/asparaginyl-tRNA synthetase